MLPPFSPGCLSDEEFGDVTILFIERKSIVRIIFLRSIKKNKNPHKIFRRGVWGGSLKMFVINSSSEAWLCEFCFPSTAK